MVNNLLELDLLISEKKMAYGLFLHGSKYWEVLIMKENNYSEFRISSKNSGQNMGVIFIQGTISKISKQKKEQRYGTKSWNHFLHIAMEFSSIKIQLIKASQKIKD